MKFDVKRNSEISNFDFNISQTNASKKIELKKNK